MATAALKKANRSIHGRLTETVKEEMASSFFFLALALVCFIFSWDAKGLNLL